MEPGTDALVLCACAWGLAGDREAEALEVLADLHGGGNQDDELVQLEYNEIRNQVCSPPLLLLHISCL